MPPAELPGSIEVESMNYALSTNDGMLPGSKWI
jgi:hypothetical protein